MTSILQEYRHWQRFSRQEKLEGEHRGAMQKLAKSGAMASRMAASYKSMAERAAAEGACYRTLFSRRMDETNTLACEGWLFVRRVVAEGGTTRVRASMLETFTLEHGIIEPGSRPAVPVTLEIFDELQVKRTMQLGCRVDRQDDDRDTRFITFVDMVRGDLKPHM